MFLHLSYLPCLLLVKGNIEKWKPMLVWLLEKTGKKETKTKKTVPKIFHLISKFEAVVTICITQIPQ